ncbi:S-adenosyl-L-methionine-dependent methyltransferase [Artomyces pyxidatus]|uniref:S-adenosyl-L-methionine-dependent methyltransferase n=1 Tax=Artomyces pyxidatus TaxID=48021 RepID=A0ACB8SJW3_9AGAM|nr:S-adenosyl-L-methionine-dependent methyltransferase [Artomyces pyxidatus]
MFFCRLDGMYNGVKAYLDGGFTFAPLENPQKIVDLGAGSGIWAIEAANLYPDAEVLAVDMEKLPNRPLPTNLKYLQLNLLDPLPLEAESFDVVHVRLLLIHLPRPDEFLKKLTDLVKPGGWLLVEELSMDDTVGGDAPAMRASFKALIQCWRSVGQVPTFPPNIQSCLEDLGAFSEVNAHKVTFPINPVSNDPKLGTLGQTFRTSLNRSFSREAIPALLAAGYTPEIQKGRAEEFDTVDWEYSVELYFLWAKKRA